MLLQLQRALSCALGSLQLRPSRHVARIARPASRMADKRPQSREEWNAFFKQRTEERARRRLEAPSFKQANSDNERLGVAPAVRIPLTTVSASMVGMVLGMAQGSKMAGMRFRAEHAHKLPTTTTGWFMYHKSKNYVVAAGGVKEGIKMGCKVSVWTAAMLVVEDLYDRHRQHKDVVSTVMASLTVAGGFSLWNRFSLPMTARTTKTALVVGLVYGGLQDAAGALRGRPVGYIDWVRGQFRNWR